MKWLLVIALLASTAQAAPVKPPCAGCIVDVPATGEGPRPLLVVLHGDREHAKAAADRWRAFTRARGYVLLALECPRGEGCKVEHSWWRWNGDPAWVKAKVAALGEATTIDTARTFVVGWSGGASYLGLRSAEWSDTFAAIVLHGGGIPPASEDCSPRALPTYFLVGAKNPLHRLVKSLRAALVKCKQDVTWNVLPRADHDGERRALTKRRASQIFDWLDTHPRR